MRCQRNARSFFRLFRRHTDCDVYAHDFNQAELERYVFARPAAGKKESGIRTHVLVFKGAWNRTSQNIYNVPELHTPKIKLPKYATDYLTPKQESRLTTISSLAEAAGRSRNSRERGYRGGFRDMPCRTLAFGN